MTKNIIGFLAMLGFLVSPALASAAVTPTLTLTVDKASVVASPKPVYANLPSLSWASANAASCTASGSGWSGPTGLSGTQKVNPPKTTTYTLTCTSTGGSVTKSVTVTVTPAQTAGALSGFEQAVTQVTSPTQTGLTHNLQIGSTGAEVTNLQTMLIVKGYLAAGNATGYFGPLTQAAVQAFQSAQGIVSSGTPSTTGYGAVGPATRAKLNASY